MDTVVNSENVRIMGILNLTPDSFYDGGRYFDVEKGIGRAKEIVDEGAHILDIGAESSRPGAFPVSADEEIERLKPVLDGISGILSVPVSLDTSKPEVAKFFLERRYVHIINDITGLRNPEMVEIVKHFDVPAIMMHMYGEPGNMQQIYEYDDVVNDIKDFFKKQLDSINHDKIIIDPGIGFGKSVTHNLEIVRRFAEFKSLGVPVMIGASRKSFIGKVLKEEAGERLEGSLGVLAIAVMNGANILRVHDVKQSVRTIKMIEAIRDASYKEMHV
jgi:dihydropteroate synthase